MIHRSAAWAAAAVVPLALLVLALPASSAQADPAPGDGGAGPSLLVGDSIARGVAGRFHREHPEFVVDAVPGRRVVSLPGRLRKDTEARGVPGRLVLELGTNTAGSWTKADFQAALDLVPSSTKVVMVTPYVRHNAGAAWTPRGSHAAERTRRYARWEYELARDNANVCIAPWRETVLRRPSLVTPAGVHPTAAGKRVFLRLLDTALLQCR